MIAASGSERAKANFQRTKEEVDQLFRSIAGRWQHREKGAESGGKSENPPKPRAIKNRDEDITLKEEFHGKVKQPQWEIHLDEVCGDRERKMSLMDKVPVITSKDGGLHVDMKFVLRNSTSGMLRGIGDRRPLTSQDIEAVDTKRNKKMQRSASTPNFLQKNARSSSLKCLRPDIRRREQAKQTQRRSQKGAQVQKHREAEVLWATANMENHLLRTRAESKGMEPAPQRYASHRISFGGKHGSSINRMASLVDVETRELFRWLAAEAFLGSLLIVKRRSRAKALWDHGITFVRRIRILSRWRKKARARHLLRLVLAVISPAFRLLVRHRKKKLALQRIQRTWRNFSLCMSLYVEKMIDHHWRKHEHILLEEMFSECPGDGDVVVGHQGDDQSDRALLCFDDEESVIETPKSCLTPEQPSYSPAALSRARSGELPRARSGELPRARSGEVSRRMTLSSRDSGQLERVSFLAKDFSRTKRTSVVPQDSGIGKRLHAGDLRGAGAIFQSAISGDIKASAAASISPFAANVDSSFAGVPAWSKLRKCVANDPNLGGIAAVVLKMKKTGKGKTQDQMFNQILDEAIRRRKKSQVDQHSFRRDIVRMILRREMVERLYDKIRQTRGKKSRISLVCDALDLSVAPMPVTLQPTSKEIAEIVLCAHYGHGARPARQDIAFKVFKSCPCWRIVAVTELVKGTRSIKDGLMDRWSVRRGHQKETIRHFRKRAQTLGTNLSFLDYIAELRMAMHQAVPVAPNRRARPSSAPAVASSFRSTSASRFYKAMDQIDDDSLELDEDEQSNMRSTLADIEVFRLDGTGSIDSGDFNDLPSQESGLRSLLPPPGFNSKRWEGCGSGEAQSFPRPLEDGSVRVQSSGRWRP